MCLKNEKRIPGRSPLHFSKHKGQRAWERSIRVRTGSLTWHRESCSIGDDCEYPSIVESTTVLCNRTTCHRSGSHFLAVQTQSKAFLDHHLTVDGSDDDSSRRAYCSREWFRSDRPTTDHLLGSNVPMERTCWLVEKGDCYRSHSHFHCQPWRADDRPTNVFLEPSNDDDRWISTNHRWPLVSMDDERSHRTLSVDDAVVAGRVGVDAYENDAVVSHWDTAFDEGTIEVGKKSDLKQNQSDSLWNLNVSYPRWCVQSSTVSDSYCYYRSALSLRNGYWESAGDLPRREHSVHASP